MTQLNSEKYENCFPMKKNMFNLINCNEMNVWLKLDINNSVVR